MASILGRLLPKLEDPDRRVRLFYAETVHYIILSGTPVWVQILMALRRLHDQVRNAQQKIAIRVARTYRTVAFEAMAVLSETPPIELLAQMYTKVYHHTCGLAVHDVNVQRGSRKGCESPSWTSEQHILPTHVCQG